MDVAVASYIRFKTKCGEYVALRNFQNFFVAETRNYNSVAYVFAPFYLSGNVSTRGGDAMQANLTTVPNALTTSIVNEAVLNSWLIEVRTLLLEYTGPGFTEGSLISQQIWSCISSTQDFEKLSIALSTPMDAAQADVPKRVLNTTLVGAIPPTGSIIAS